MLDKVNICRIVRDHIRTMKNHSTKAYRPADFVLFFLIPLAPALITAFYYGPLQHRLVGVIATSLSIFTALLLNLLVLAYNVARSGEPTTSRRRGEVKEQLFHEIFSNIAFAILVALTTVGLVLIVGMMDVQPGVCERPRICFPTIPQVLSCVVYYLSVLFLLTMLMLLKRVYALLTNERVTPTMSETE